jgi:hypothetical protein
MPISSFHDRLQNRPDEASAVDRLATLIAQSGAEGISVDCLKRLCGLPPESLAEVLNGLISTRQVVMVKVGGELRYRAG